MSILSWGKSVLVVGIALVMGLVGSLEARAAGPYVFTTNATSVTKTTAVLNAYATSINASANISFEYGTSRSFGSQTGSVSVAGSGDPASIKLTGLNAGTKYYFRAIVAGEGATDKGVTLSFTTIGANVPDDYDNENGGSGGSGSGSGSSGGSSAVRPAVSTLQASGVTGGSAILNATIANPNSGDVKVWFQYGIEAGNLTSTRTQRMSGSQFAASEAVTGLSPNTTYFYRGVAQNTTGITIGDLRSFETTGGSGSGGGSTGGASTLTALTYGTTRISASAYRLSGAVLTASESGSAWMEWGSTTGLGNKTAAENVTALTTRQFTRDITGLVAGRTYYYRAVAKASNTEVKGETLSFVVAKTTSTGGGQTLDPDTTKNPVTLTLTITKNGKETDGDELTVDAGDRVSMLLTAVNTGSPTKASVSLTAPEGLTFLGGDGAQFDRTTRVVTIATDLPKGVTEKSAEFLADTVTGDASLRARLQAGAIDISSNEVLLKKAGALVSGVGGTGFWSGILGGGGSCTLLWILIIVVGLAFAMIKVYGWMMERKHEHDEEKELPPTITLPE